MTRGCKGSGDLDDANFSKPLPIIGFYVAVATFYCAAAMGADAFLGLRSRRFWFPNKYFTLNAATLTILAVATKLPVDLNTSMPSAVDQLSKLSSTVLICTVMGNLIPSLGVMDNPVSNILALAILSLTVIVNVGIQMGTGVIYVFRHEHIVIIIFMLLLLILLISSALPISTTKDELEKLYDDKLYQLENIYNPKYGQRKEVEYDERELRECVKVYWLMAHTSSPQYVLARSATCTASGAFCLVSAIVLLQASIRSFFEFGHPHFCRGTSDYGRSIIVVVILQAVAVIVGTIAPAARWFSAVNYWRPDVGRVKWRDEFRVEEYWIKKLTELKEAPLSFQLIRNWQCRKIIQSSKNEMLGLLIKAQRGVVLASKVVCLVSILLVNHGKKLFKTLDQTQSSLGGSQNMEDFVLHLEGEDGLVKLITKDERRHTERWIEKGKKRSPKYLESLIKLDRIRHESCQAFIWVSCIDGDGVGCLSPNSEGKDLENCWALPIVVLATIASALPHVDHSSLKMLQMGVDEGLVYVRKIEENLEARGLQDQRKAADIIWSSLKLHNRWFDLDLRGEMPQSTKGVIQKLVKLEEGKVAAFLGKNGKDKTQNGAVRWPPRVLAANCMYRLGSTILRHLEENRDVETHILCWLRVAISHILRACLTNLREFIQHECSSSPIEVREERVRALAFTLGETETIMSKLSEPGVASCYPSDGEYLDSWRGSRRSISEWRCEDCGRGEMLCSASSSTLASWSLPSNLSSISSHGFGTDNSVRSSSKERLPHDQEPSDSVV